MIFTNHYVSKRYKKILSLSLILTLIVFSPSLLAKINILTTTTNLKSIVEEIGKDKINVESLAEGTQDPHFLQARPSYMLKASKADLIISIGLELEIGWLPLIIKGSRNPKLRPGQSGSLITGNFINTLEKSHGKISRADGDVHPEGNPHFLLDPKNATLIAQKIRDKLSELDRENAHYYEKNFLIFESKINNLLNKWKKMIKENLNVLTYHKTLSYFYKRFKIQNIGYIEPKPGIPPTANHILKLNQLLKTGNITFIIIENYFDPAIAYKMTSDLKNINIKIVPVAVEGKENIHTLIDLYEYLAKVFEV